MSTALTQEQAQLLVELIETLIVEAAETFVFANDGSSKYKAFEALRAFADDTSTQEAIHGHR
jgi:hypothetical protein